MSKHSTIKNRLLEILNKDFKNGEELQQVLSEVSLFKFASLYSYVRLTSKAQSKDFTWDQKIKSEYQLVIKAMIKVCQSNNK